MTNKTTRKSTDKELLELGKKLQAFYDMGYVNKKQALLFSFLKGAAGGFGAFLGGTILIALLIWVLSLFQDFPILSHLFEAFERSVESK